MFTLKQGWAALFGLLFLAAIMITKAIWQPDWPITRYDGLFLFAILNQVLFFVLRLKTWEEVKVIFLLHLTGTIMEVFKQAQGSWYLRLYVSLVTATQVISDQLVAAPIRPPAREVYPKGEVPSRA